MVFSRELLLHVSVFVEKNDRISLLLICSHRRPITKMDETNTSCAQDTAPRGFAFPFLLSRKTCRNLECL